jgi:hypothetical protein
MARLFFNFFYVFCYAFVTLLLRPFVAAFSVSQYRGLFYQQLLPWVYFGFGFGVAHHW